MERRQLLAAAAAAVAAPWARAESGYPSQPLRWVVPYPAGGGTDVLARTVAEAMRQTLGQQIVVDNRPGAATNIGGQLVATAKPDGYTVMSADNAILAYNEHLFSKLPFSPEKDFTYVGGISRFPLLLVVNPAFEAQTVKDFLAYARAHPGKLNYASPGNGSPHHLAMEMFKSRTKTFLTHIPYRGAAPALQDVMGGQVPCMFLELPAGLPGSEVYAFQGLVGPAGLPAGVVQKLNAAVNQVLKDPAVVKRMHDYGMEAQPSPARRSSSWPWRAPRADAGGR